MRRLRRLSDGLARRPLRKPVSEVSGHYKDEHGEERVLAGLLATAAAACCKEGWRPRLYTGMGVNFQSK